MNLRPFVLNSIPKSGTHLLLQAVKGIPDVEIVPPVIMGEFKKEDLDIHDLSINQFIYGHLFYSEKYEEIFKKHEVKQLLMIRDPRDVILSLYYYMFKVLPHHPVRRYAEKNELNKEEIINSLILGISDEDFLYEGTNKIITRFSSWMKNPDVLVLRYEELNDPAKQDKEFFKILFHLSEGNEARKYSGIIESMKNNIIPEHSGTFRKGRSGEWETEFTNINKKVFHQNCQKLLTELGYE